MSTTPSEGVSHELRCAHCHDPAVASLGGVPGSPTDAYTQRSVCLRHGQQLLRSLHGLVQEYDRAAREGRPDDVE